MTASTTIGLCIVCQRDIAVRPDAARGHALVHHGYNRPGIGCIVGDCFAVGMPPHELAPDAAKAYLDFCEKQYQREKERLKLLETRTIACIHMEVTVPVPTTSLRPVAPWFTYRSRDGSLADPGWTKWLAPYYPNETDAERRQIYERLCLTEADRTKSQMRMLDVEIIRMKRTIPEWELKPLREREKVVPGASGRRRRRMRRGVG